MISFKLPNFFNNTSLNTLKDRMGIDMHTYGDFGDSQYQGARVQIESIGVEIESISDITPLDDYTLTFKGERVVLYIRDVNDWGDKEKLPKFHVAHCSTLQSMFSHGKKRRYVASQNESDTFHLNFINGKSVRKIEHSLNICKNCLEILRWNDYSKSWSYDKKNQCVSHFQIKDFFSKYPKALIGKDGYSNKNSPLNQYSSNWSQISHQYKSSQKWICEQCNVNLINNKRLLHTHHINSQKNENNYSNLMALCVYCHAHQPMHDHMHNSPDMSKDIKEVLDVRKRQGIN